MSTVVSEIAQLSVIFPPIFTTSKPNIDPFISSRKNVLSIDLAENQNYIPTSSHFPLYRSEQVGEDLTSNSVREELETLKASQEPVLIHKYFGQPRPEDLERNVLLIHRIRKLVLEDVARQPEDRIDCVKIGPEPWPEHLRALDGLSPKHLQVSGGLLEYINVVELDKLNTKFKLESLCISNVMKDWSHLIPASRISSESSLDPTPNKPRYNHCFPEFFIHVRSLTLDYCSGISFQGTNLPTHLRQLKIIGNNALDMFIHAVDNIPNVSEQLERVFIYSNPKVDLSDAFWLDDFRERLRWCKGLKDLTLVLADDYKAEATNYADLYHAPPGEPNGEAGSDGFDVGLSRSFPNSIERLEFHCSNSKPMLADLDRWIEAAKEPKWLPRLKYIHICTYEAERFQYSDEHETVVDEGKERTFSEKIRRVYEVLKSRSPPVEIGQ